MSNELLTTCLDLLETAADLTEHIPLATAAPQDSKGTATTAKIPAAGSAVMHSAPPQWILALRRWFNEFTTRHIFSVIFGTWAVLVALSFVTSALISLLTLQAAVLAGIVVFNLEEASENRGWRGPVYASLVWLLTSMAVVVPLFFPVEVTFELIRWVMRLAKG